MVNQGNPYTAGYEAAYREIYEILNDVGHHGTCGQCRPCGVIRETVEILMETLASKCTQEEFFSLAMILNRTNTRVEDSEGNLFIDIWGEMNGAVGEDGGYGWPKEGQS